MKQRNKQGKKKIAKSLKERGCARAACAARITCKIHLVDPEGAKVENEEQLTTEGPVYVCAEVDVKPSL